MRGRTTLPLVLCAAACSSNGRSSTPPPPVIAGVNDGPSTVGESCDLASARDALNPLTGNVKMLSICHDDGWCLENAPKGSFLHRAWALDDDDVWAVGYTVREPSTGLLLHWDGLRGSAYDVALPPLHGVWGSRSDDVWAVGNGGTLAHWDGQRWTKSTSPTGSDLFVVSGTSSTDVWAVGYEAALHWDGERWSLVPSWAAAKPYGLGFYAISADDAVAAYSGGCRRWDGRSWNETACGVKGGTAVWASGSDDVWVLGISDAPFPLTTSYAAHWDGETWSTKQSTPGSGATVFGSGPNDVWIDGTQHFDGHSWSPQPCGGFRFLSGVSAKGTLWGTAGPSLVRGVGDQTAVVADVGAESLQAGAGTGVESFWAVAGRGNLILSFDGNSFTSQRPVRRIHDAQALFGSSATDIWALCFGGTALCHWDGTDWTTMPSGPTGGLVGWAFSKTDAFLIRQSWPTQETWTWDGTSWTPGGWPFSLRRDGTWTVWASAPDDVWASFTSGNGTTVFHRDASHWTSVWSTARSGMGTRITGTRRGDVWLLAANAVWHWDGATFAHSADFDFPETIGASAPDDVWVANAQGRLWHFDGTTWSEAAPLERTFPTLLGVPPVGVFGFSQYGGISYRRR